jgi:VanZ family protein
MLLCMGTIFILSHQPAGAIDFDLFPAQDKVAHLLLYGVLSATVLFAFSLQLRDNNKTLVVTALLVPVLFGILDEYHQSFIAGRSSELLDVAADGAGAVLVCTFWLLWGPGGRRGEN